MIVVRPSLGYPERVRVDGDSFNVRTPECHLEVIKDGETVAVFREWAYVVRLDAEVTVEEDEEQVVAPIVAPRPVIVPPRPLGLNLQQTVDAVSLVGALS